MNNHEFRCKQLEAEIEELKIDKALLNTDLNVEKLKKEHWRGQFDYMKDQSEKQQERIAELEKQIESMRNCLNCENYKLSSYSFDCTLVSKCKTNIMEKDHPDYYIHWTIEKPKESK